MIQIDIEDYVRGCNDAKAGKEHQKGKGFSYDRGYGDQYEIEQVRDAKTIRQERES